MPERNPKSAKRFSDKLRDKTKSESEMGDS